MFVTGTNNLFVSGGKIFISHRGDKHFYTQGGPNIFVLRGQVGKICVHSGEEGQSFSVVCRARQTCQDVAVESQD